MGRINTTLSLEGASGLEVLPQTYWSRVITSWWPLNCRAKRKAKSLASDLLREHREGARCHKLFLKYLKMLITKVVRSWFFRNIWGEEVEVLSFPFSLVHPAISLHPSNTMSLIKNETHRTNPIQRIPCSFQTSSQFSPMSRWLTLRMLGSPH